MQTLWYDGLDAAVSSWLSCCFHDVLADDHEALASFVETHRLVSWQIRLEALAKASKSFQVPPRGSSWAICPEVWSSQGDMIAIVPAMYDPSSMYLFAPVLLLSRRWSLELNGDSSIGCCGWCSNFFKLKQQVILYCWAPALMLIIHSLSRSLGQWSESLVGHLHNGFLPKNSDNCSSELRHELVHFCTGLHSMDCEFLKGISPYDGKLSVKSCPCWLREQQYYAIFRRRNVHKVALIQSRPLKKACSAQECPRFRWPKKSWQISMLLTVSSPICLYLQA